MTPLDNYSVDFWEIFGEIAFCVVILERRSAFLPPKAATEATTDPPTH
jgi:hypothetical protein